MKEGNLMWWIMITLLKNCDLISRITIKNEILIKAIVL